jgi:hypothetical protein
MEGKLKFNVIKEYNTPDSKHPSIIVRWNKKRYLLKRYLFFYF